MGSEVSLPHTFKPNTPAKAAEVNANFTAVKSAVRDNVDTIRQNVGKITTNTNDIAANKTVIQTNANDIATNANDITANAGLIAGHSAEILNNQTGIQNNKAQIQANTAAIGNKISSVTASPTSGIVVTPTGNDVALKRADGFVAISPFAFITGDDEHCYSNKPWFIIGATAQPGYHFTQASPAISNICWAYAPVNLPDGAKIKRFECHLKKNDGKTNKGALQVSLKHGKINIKTLKLAADFNDPDWQTVGEDIDPAKVVDNSAGGYTLLYLPPSVSGTADGEKDYVGECKIAYSFE